MPNAGGAEVVAELEDKERFAELLALGITALKQHPDYKTIRKKRETLPSGQFASESYIDKIAYQLGISSNTIKSWMGQMGVKYIPSRIEDGKLFGIIWLIIEKSGMDAGWFTELLGTTSIPVINPPLPVWVASCLSKAKLLRDDEFGAPSDQEIEAVKTRLFDGISQPQKPAVPAAPQLSSEAGLPKKQSTCHKRLASSLQRSQVRPNRYSNNADNEYPAFPMSAISCLIGISSSVIWAMLSAIAFGFPAVASISCK